MNNPRLFIIGHSHLAAIETAHRHRQLTGNGTLAATFLQLRRPGLRMNPDAAPDSPEAWSPAARKLYAEARPERVVSCIAGNSHTVLGLVEHPQRFDFVLDEAPDLPLDDSREILPCALVSALMTRQMQNGIKVMQAMRHLATVPVVHVDAPPPVASAEHILAHPDAFEAQLKAQGLTPAIIRLKLWRLQSALTRRLCQEHGFAFLPPPETALTAEGYLAPQAWNPDPSHGNAWYGEQVLAQLERHATTGAPA